MTGLRIGPEIGATAAAPAVDRVVFLGFERRSERISGAVFYLWTHTDEICTLLVYETRESNSSRAV